MILFSKKEWLVAGSIFCLSFLLVFISRNSRLNSDYALAANGTAEILLYERTSLESLSEILDSLDVKVDQEELLWAGRILGWRYFRPGRYEINGNESYPVLLANMARGIQDPASVTIVPGTEIDRFTAHLSKQLLTDSASVAAVFSDSSEVVNELNLTPEQLFSRMLPNTYQIYWTTPAENVIRRIHSEFNNHIAVKYNDRIEESDFTLKEILTLASIVEWEARFSEEKPKISGLYINRLNRNMRLQADPTVLYALGERRRILLEDYQFDHPYNTYLYSGLPPGPITNPDEESILAVLEPEDHDYLFMVATPTGGHTFTRTFEEHLEASREWRRWIREQYRIKREREREAAEMSD